MLAFKIYHLLKLESENNPTQFVWSVILAAVVVFFLGFVAIQGFVTGQELVRSY